MLRFEMIRSSDATDTVHPEVSAVALTAEEIAFAADYAAAAAIADAADAAEAAAAVAGAAAAVLPSMAADPNPPIDLAADHPPTSGGGGAAVDMEDEAAEAEDNGDNHIEISKEMIDLCQDDDGMSRSEFPTAHATADTAATTTTAAAPVGLPYQSLMPYPPEAEPIQVRPSVCVCVCVCVCLQRFLSIKSHVSFQLRFSFSIFLWCSPSLLHSHPILPHPRRGPPPQQHLKYLCPHGKLAPHHTRQLKRVSPAAWEAISQSYTTDRVLTQVSE
jgi:hypothetical protein